MYKYDTIQFEVDDGVATIRLNRPDKLNSLNAAMRRELREALHAAQAAARAILLTGAGRAFCAGQDLGDVDPARGADLRQILRQEYEPLVQAISDAPVPVVCAVNGPAAGAGANLAFAADIVIATRSASFLEAFTRIGLVPDAGGTFWLPRMVGMPRAMAMCLLADTISAEQAEQWGLIWRMVEDDQFVAESQALAKRLAAGPTLALRLTKQALRASMSNDWSTQLALEADLQQQAAESKDFVEGVQAFLEKRPAQYEGK